MIDWKSEAVSHFNAAVGEAIMTWSYVEWLHCELFAMVATGQAQNKPLTRAYWAIVSFEGKHKMVDAALRDALMEHPTFRARWANIANRIQKKGKFRNKIAHGSLIATPTGDNERLAVVQSVYSKTAWKPEDEISLERVEEATKAFHQLGEDLLDFQRDFFLKHVGPKGQDVTRYHYPREDSP